VKRPHAIAESTCAAETRSFSALSSPDELAKMWASSVFSSDSSSIHTSDSSAKQRSSVVMDCRLTPILWLDQAAMRVTGMAAPMLLIFYAFIGNWSFFLTCAEAHEDNRDVSRSDHLTRL
jgi:hypothetical protein